MLVASVHGGDEWLDLARLDVPHKVRHHRLGPHRTPEQGQVLQVPTRCSMPHHASMLRPRRATFALLRGVGTAAAAHRAEIERDDRPGDRAAGHVPAPARVRAPAPMRPLPSVRA